MFRIWVVWRMTVLVHLIVMLGMLVVVPAGLALLDEPGAAWVRRWWWVGALPGVVSLWLPRGVPAAVLAALYAAATVALAVRAPARFVRNRSLAPAEIAALTALVTPAIAALALVAERFDYELFGFELTILALTVPHFHFAGFAAALIAGLVCRTADTPAARLGALSVPAGTLLVLLGYFVNDWTELAGAALLTTGMWLVGWVTWQQSRRTTGDRVTRVLLAVSAVVLVATMLLALSWALGQATGIAHLSLAWMVATHGLGNALGFALCALLAWHRLNDPPRRHDPPRPNDPHRPKETTPPWNRNWT